MTGFLGDSDADLLAGISRVASLDRSACRQVAEQRFSIAVMASNYVNAYERELIQSTPTTTAASAWR